MCLSQFGIRAILAHDVSLLWDFKLAMLEWLLFITFLVGVIVGLLLSSCCLRTSVVKVPVRRIDGAQAILGASSLAALRLQ